MQVTTVSFVPETTQARSRPEETVRRDKTVQPSEQVLTPPPDNKARAQINTDVLAIGNGSGSEDLRAAQADWQRIQSGKAVTAAKREAEEEVQSERSNAADDLAAIALAAQSGNAAAVLAAQHRLAQHVLML